MADITVFYPKDNSVSKWGQEGVINQYQQWILDRDKGNTSIDLRRTAKKRRRSQWTITNPNRTVVSVSVCLCDSG
jgi:hypothetical protein